MVDVAQRLPIQQDRASLSEKHQIYTENPFTFTYLTQFLPDMLPTKRAQNRLEHSMRCRYCQVPYDAFLIRKTLAGTCPDLSKQRYLSAEPCLT